MIALAGVNSFDWYSFSSRFNLACDNDFWKSDATFIISLSMNLPVEGLVDLKLFVFLLEPNRWAVSAVLLTSKSISAMFSAVRAAFNGVRSYVGKSELTRRLDKSLFIE